MGSQIINGMTVKMIDSNNVVIRGVNYIVPNTSYKILNVLTAAISAK